MVLQDSRLPPRISPIWGRCNKSSIIEFHSLYKNINQANEAPPRYARNPSAPSSKYERWPRCTLLAPKGALYVMMCLNMIMMFLYMIMMRLDISNFNPPQTLTIYGDIIPVVSTVNHEHHPCFNAQGSKKITYSVSYTSVVPHFLRLEYFVLFWGKVYWFSNTVYRLPFKR